MPLRRFLLRLVPVLAAATSFTSAIGAPRDSADNSRAAPRRAGGILYVPKAGATAQQQSVRDWVLDLHGSRAVSRCAKSRLHVDTVDTAGTSEEDVCRLLVASGAVEFAEPDYLVPPADAPNDPYLDSQWFHTRIESQAAWDAIPSGIANRKTPVIVAVCDSGIQSGHPDLAARLMTGINIVDGSGATGPVAGAGGWHGTAAAGCISAIGDNAVGLAGVAWRVNVRILPVRITNRTDLVAQVSDIAAAITYSADRGAKVVNVSYVAAQYASVASAGSYLRSKGGLLFLSAGNENYNGSAYPDYGSIVVVGAVDSSDRRASFSNYGPFIDLVAPGVNIATTLTSGDYGTVSGTSFSSPIAAGLAALIYAVNPSFTPTDVQNLLFDNCDAIGSANTFGRGRINARKSVEAALAIAGGNLAPTASFTADPGSGTAPLFVRFDASASSDSDGNVASYLWDFGDGAKGTGVNPSHTYTKAGEFTVRLTAVDDKDGADTFEAVISVAPDPTVLTAPANLIGSRSGTSVTLNWTDTNLAEDGSQIQRRARVIGSTTWSTWRVVATAEADVQTWSLVVSSGRVHEFRIRAVKLSGDLGPFSNRVAIKVP